MTIMPFSLGEQQALIARLGSTPIVSTHQVFQQDHPVILQLGLANLIKLVVSIDRNINIFTTIAHLNITILQQSLKVVVEQCSEKLDVGWITYDTDSRENVLLFCRFYCCWKESSKSTAGSKKVVADLLCIRQRYRIGCIFQRRILADARNLGC